MAAEVDLGPVQNVGQAPETEDRRFTPNRARLLRRLPQNEFWSLLQRAAGTSLNEIFGEELVRRGRGAALDEGEGQTSLGVFSPGYIRLRTYNDGNSSKVKVEVEDDELGSLLLGLTDLRFYDQGQQQHIERVVTDVGRRVTAGVDVLLSVGVGRPWRKPGDTAKRHWLQVNNIHMSDDPAWGV
jgi:hypothetical protein